MRVTSPIPGSDRVSAAAAEFQRGATEAAEASLREVLVHEPAREDAAMLLARVLQSSGRLGAAASVLLACCEANSFEPGMSLRCVTFVRQCDRHSVAERICRGALAQRGVTPDLLVLAGHVAREAGDFVRARERYLAALEAGVDLDRQYVLGALANTRRYVDPADPDIVRFARELGDTARSPRARASAGFAFAKAQGDLGDYAAAVATLRSANALMRPVRPWERSAWRDSVATRKCERVASAGQVNGDFVPVFVVGMPRSGTTLAAALLAQASPARDRGELRTLRFIAGQLVAGGYLSSRAAVAEAAGLYRRLAVQDDAPVTWYIDQDPMNFRWLHIATAMFPQARIIHLRRSPRDTALSLWGQDFAHPDLAFAYDFDDIAAAIDGHDGLMRHWGTALPLSILNLDYEALVADPDGGVAKMRVFIGAPVGGAEAAAPVQSASVWQARQPVYRTSVDRWRHYLPYEPALARFPERPGGAN